MSQWKGTKYLHIGGITCAMIKLLCEKRHLEVLLRENQTLSGISARVSILNFYLQLYLLSSQSTSYLLHHTIGLWDSKISERKDFLLGVTSLKSKTMNFSNCRG